MPSEAPPILVAALWCLTFGGLVLAIIGWRGRRIDDHPLCRRCGYDLVANARATNCPECGRLIASRGAVRIGHRRRRPLLLALGVMVMTLAGASAGIVRWLDARDFRWITIRPVWLLERDVASTDVGAIMSAREELLDRLNAGRLSQRQINAIIDDSLTMQADLSATWPQWRGDFIEDAWILGKTGDATLKRYLETAIDQALYLRVRQHVRQGQAARIELMMRPKRAGRSRNGSLFMITHGSAIVADGQTIAEIDTRAGGHVRGVAENYSAGDSPAATASAVFDLPVGPHVVGIDVSFRVHARPGNMPFQAGFSATRPDDWQFVISRRVECPIKIIERDSPGVRLAADPTLERRMRAAVRPTLTEQTLADSSRRIFAWVSFHSPPMNVAFDVFLRDAASGRERHIGQVFESAGGGRSRAMNVELTEETAWIAESKSLEFVFRPNAQAAEAAYDIFEIWDGELVLTPTPIRLDPSRR